MPAGLQIFDERGALRLSLGDRIGRFTGEVTTEGIDGSVVVDGTNTGEPFFILTAVDNPIGWFSPPVVTMSGGTISWRYQPTPGNPQKINCRIRYGVY